MVILGGFSIHAQVSITSGGRFIRGTSPSTNLTYDSFVIPLDQEQGTTNAPALATTLSIFSVSTLYHYNYTNAGSQSFITNRIAYTNAIAAFGGKYGGSPLYLNQAYHFGAYAGSPAGSIQTRTNAFLITLVDRTTGAYVGGVVFTVPIPSVTNGWNAYLTNGGTTTFTYGGLTTTFSYVADLDWGTHDPGGLTLTHVAGTNAANYEFTVWVQGLTDTGFGMTEVANNTVFWTPLYTMDFDQRPPWLATFVSQPQFQGQPMPSAYAGKSLTELLATHATVTNAVSSAATNWLDLDNSPELRASPVLDQFVADMGSNALALAGYVQNRIELTDALAYNNNTNLLADPSVNLGGVNRSALGTYMEGQGSPVEQCSLLVYLLRKAGVPAAYIYGPNDGVQMVDTSLSKLLRMQIKGAVNVLGQVYTTNTLISVNYPWVAAYVNGQWVHLFPWLKDTEVTEGLNLYDYMPADYNNGYKWVRHYLAGDTNILSLSTETDVPSALFAKFIQKSLLTTGPGISLDDIGTTCINRQNQYSRWSDFPTPFAVTNGTVNTVHDLTSITNIYPSWTNIWDTISVRVYSNVATNKSIFTGDLRTLDLHDRKFLIRHQATNSNYNLILSLAPYRPSATNTYAFTNDAALLNHEQLQMTLATTDDNLTIQFTRKRHRVVPGAVTNTANSYLGVAEQLQFSTTSPLRLGDLATICLNSGRVSKQMVETWAQEYWTMQQQVKANPAITNTLSPDITQGTLPYLMGMSYYERLSRFDDQLQQLHKVQIGSLAAEGLSKLNANRDASGHLTSPLTLYHPNVDMAYLEMSAFGNSTLRPDESADAGVAKDAFERLSITEGSAQEHKVIEDFYGKSGGISSVRLLWQAQQSGQPGMVELNINNYSSYAGLATYDSNIWQHVVSAFTTATTYDPNFANVFITAKPVTNSAVAYTGMGALIYAGNFYAAFISGNQMPQNGGWGLPLTTPIYNPPDFNNISLTFNTSYNSSWNVTYSAPTFSAPAPLAESISFWNTPTTYSYLSSGALTFGGADAVQQQQFDVASASLGLSAASAYQDTINNGGGYDAHVGDNYAQLASTIADPVNAVTGEFYVDATDLSLPGPMPLLVRRNYSSQNVDMGDSQFGYGWRPAYQPYLRLVGTNLIYAAEMDGTVVAYRQTGTNTWKPQPADNPQLDNRSSAGIGSTANLFNNFITNVVSGVTTNFYLNGADGSVRFFQYASYPISGSTGNLNRTRPYLQQWQDACGNSYVFTYQTDSAQPDYGQVVRVQSSNGNFLNYDFDVFGHIVRAATEDGLELLYDYDEHGDLVTVTLPDLSQINYVYQHSTVVTNGVTNIVSSHLIVSEQKPDGRTLANTYDSLRRVTTQAATVGVDLNLVTNATFIYSNTFTNLTNSVITGTTCILDVFGRTNIYQYTSNLITSMADELGRTQTQTWFSNTNDAGYYPHSLKSNTDKRGLKTDYQYDAFGNLKQVTLTGNLTGSGLTNETAVYAFTYTAQNLISTATDPASNQAIYCYTNSAYPLLPTAIVKTAAGTPVSTNQYFYTSVSQVATNGAIYTNRSYGLLQRTIRGGTAMNDSLYDGRGFLARQIGYTGTGDPAVTNSFFYNDRDELEQKTDAAGRSRLYAYDAMGRQTAEEVYEANQSNPMSWNYSYYNENGDLVWTDGPRYNPEDYIWRDYDGAGRKITEMHWRSEAQANGGGVEAVAGNNLYATTFYQYDAFNNLVQVTDPLGNYTIKKYDGVGQLTNEVAYSAAGVALATNQYAYEAGGLLTNTVNPLGGVTTRQYSSLGKLIAQSNPDGSTNAWQYYSDGRVRREILANGNYWETIYDDAHLLVTRDFHNASATLATVTQQFDPRGNLIQSVDAEGNVFTNFYDGLDRLKLAAGPQTFTVAATGFPPGSAPFVTNIAQQVEAYIYDGSGQMLTVSNALGEKAVTISDVLGRPTQVAVYATNGSTVRVTSAYYSPDHQSLTVTNGTGANAIIITTYTDNDNHPVLTSGCPTSGTTEFVLEQYDRAGNHVAEQQASFNGSLTVWATNGWSYDGLNRPWLQVSRDGAATTTTFDALGDVTSRAMSGGLTWSATYFNDGRPATEQISGGTQTARAMTYSYYPAGSPFAGKLSVVTDGRGTTRTNGYDDFLRLATVGTGGSLPEQKTLTTFQYDRRNLLTNMVQSFNSGGTGPATTLTRSYDGYGNIASENVFVAGSLLSSVGQSWDNAGRRIGLTLPSSMGIGFAYRADGLMTGAGDASFGYGNSGLLIGRTNNARCYTVNQRDGRGRILQTTTSVNMSPVLAETLAWRNDGRLNNYTAQRDFTDTRTFSYSPLAQRLTQESLNVSSSQRVTNNYTIDRGTTGGLGILTSAAQAGGLAGTWSVPSGGMDGLSRVAQSQDTLINRPATGLALGAASVSGALDGYPVNVAFDGSDAEGRWRANLDLTGGSHVLKLTAAHPSGLYTAYATNSFTVTASADTLTNQYDGQGNITKRIWITAAGTTNRTQTFTWDAFDRVIKVADRDSLTNGLDFVAIYDGLGRRIRTTSTMVVSNTPITTPSDAVSTVDSTYDPQAEFLEVGVAVNGSFTLKTYGPDANGIYGGLNGAGGLEDVTLSGRTTSTSIIQDNFGNILGSVSGGTVAWNPTRFNSYGPVPGYQSPSLSLNVSLVQSLGWRGKRVDETGLIYLGARQYDPQSGRFISSDPLGINGSKDLYSFAQADPANFFDPSGRFGKQMGPSWFDQLQQQLPNQSDDFINSYKQTQADMQQTMTAGYRESGSDQQSFSSLVNMIPVIGGLKMWVELNTGNDLVTGQRIQANDYAQAAMIGLSFLPVAFAAAPEEMALNSDVTFAAKSNFGVLGDVTTSPWLADGRAGVTSHLEMFRNGGSFLLPESAYNRFVQGATSVGRADGLFVTTRGAMDKMLVETGGDLGAINKKLGNFWNEPLWRVDIDNPLLHNARLPNGFEAGANSLFKWGGYTKGGMPEAVLDPVSVGKFTANPLP